MSRRNRRLPPQAEVRPLLVIFGTWALCLLAVLVLSFDGCV